MDSFARAQAAYENMMPPEPDFDCECDDDHDYCDESDCECVGHMSGCDICHVSHGCVCDDLYESWKDQRMEDGW